MNMPGRAYLMDLKTGKSTVMADRMPKGLRKSISARPSLGNSLLPTELEIRWYDVNLPPDFDRNKKYPLIVYYYGGTSPSQRDEPCLHTPAASRDYVVYI